jgi:hypothetical protein
MNAEMKAENTEIDAKYTEMKAENAEMKAESSRRACAQLVWRLNADWETNCTASCPVLPACCRLREPRVRSRRPLLWWWETRYSQCRSTDPKIKIRGHLPVFCFTKDTKI